MIPPAAPTRIVTRSVVGRAASPYRGTINDDPHAERAPAPPRPLAEISAALRAIPSVTATRTANRFDLRRSLTETLVIACRGDTPALADLTLVGDEHIAILALEALVPMFGAIEFSFGEYRDLVDETEPGVAYARYEQFVREKAARLAAALEKQRVAEDAFRLQRADSLVKPQRQSRTALRAVLILAAVTLSSVTVWSIRHFSKRATGETCETDGQCRSGECLRGAHHDRRYRYEVSVCSDECMTNADCPSDMQCRREFTGYTAKIRNMCEPRTWDSYSY